MTPEARVLFLVLQRSPRHGTAGPMRPSPVPPDPAAGYSVEAELVAPPGELSRAFPTGRILSVDPVGLLVPKGCACCGEAASYSRIESSAQGKSLIIPYCGDCYRHGARTFTRSLATALASGILGITLAVVLPLACFRLPLGIHWAVTASAAALPWMVARRWRPRLGPQHAALGRAVWFLSDGRLCCRNSAWAEQLLSMDPSLLPPRHSAGESEVPSDPPSEAADLDRAVAWEARKKWPWLALGLAGLLALATASNNFFYPLVRVLNLQDESVLLNVDGHFLGRVESSAGESPTAGVELYVPAGRRHWVVTTREGKIVSDLEVAVTPGEQHLFAPGDHDWCFWIETTSYGRNLGPEEQIRRLSRVNGFWELPSEVDSWFVPNPSNGAQNQSTSGGQLTALRQARCSDAP